MFWRTAVIPLCRISMQMFFDMFEHYFLHQSLKLKQTQGCRKLLIDRSRQSFIRIDGFLHNRKGLVDY
jgi:hypothetical protein